MPKWLRKTFVVMTTLLTFGTITPPATWAVENTKADESSKSDIVEQDLKEQSLSNDLQKRIAFENNELPNHHQYTKYLMSEAESLSLEKFGRKIRPKIEDEFREVILPRIEEVITIFAEQHPEETVDNLVITEQPSGGMSEKIFDIYDKTTGKDILRFHVRRDQPPLEGFWFNFHYHTYHDDFQTHYELGKIYWDKNTPPQWMS